MNLSLLDPFVLAQEYPENLSYTLKAGHSTCIRFNWQGDILASGRIDGVVVLFDMETRSLAQVLTGHTSQIQSLSWSASGRYLLSASQDWTACLWDLQDGTRIGKVRFDSAVYSAELHPFNHNIFVAALFEDAPYLIDLAVETHKVQKHLLPSVPKRSPTGDAEDGEIDEKQALQDTKQLTTACVFAANGRAVIAGTNKGWINIIHTDTRQVISSTQLTSSCITYIRLTSSGRDMVVNATDRILRTIHLPASLYTTNGPDPITVEPESLELEVEHKLQNVINKIKWNHCCFSSTGEYVSASTYKHHDIYVWERNMASLVKILEGPKEELGVVEWHPVRPLVAAVGIESGVIFLWANEATQQWSALAPDFEEVEENVEYVEHEDEFDIHPTEELKRRRMGEEDEEVDVFTITGSNNGYGGFDNSSHEDPDAAYYGETEQFCMPVIVGLEDTGSEASSPRRGRSPANDAGSGGTGAVVRTASTAASRGVSAGAVGVSKSSRATNSKRRRGDL